MKVSICAWHLLRNRWPTKENLSRRVIISLDSQLCVTGCSQHESASHLSIHCPIFGSLWQHVKNWIGVYFVDPQHVQDHCHQFSFSTEGYTPSRSFLHMIWLCTIWVLWNERNNMCSQIKSNQLCSCWKRLKTLCLAGWKLRMLAFL